MVNRYPAKTVVRRSFAKIEDLVPISNLIDIQSSSFNDFVQLDYLPKERKTFGLEKALRDTFPIDYEDKLSLEYVDYQLGYWACICGKLVGIENRYTWKCSSCKKSDCSRLDNNLVCSFCDKKTAQYIVCSYCLSRVSVQLPMSLDECRVSGHTFSLPLKVTIQLISWVKDESGNKVVRDIKEQSIFFADLPVMADLYEKEGRFKLGNLGTFLVNGIARVIVSQLHRSPGVVFSRSKKVKDYQGKPYYLARIIPMRGSWIDFEFDSNDLLYVRIDKKKKFLVTTFLQILGIERNKILSYFYSFDSITVKNDKFFKKITNSLIGYRIEKGMLSEKEEKPFVGKRITKEILSQFKKKKHRIIGIKGKYSFASSISARCY